MQRLRRIESKAIQPPRSCGALELEGAMSGSKTPYVDWSRHATPDPRDRTAFVEHGTCQCSKPAPWYASGGKVFALVTYIATLVWVTLLMLGAITQWAWVMVVGLWFLALAYAYGYDGKGGRL